jgi:hypothetical protein
MSEMNIRYTKHQVARGAFTDAESGEKIYLFKNVSFLRLTYQIRLLLFRATDERRKLVVRVPRNCQLDPALSGFVTEHHNALKIEKV